MIQKKSLKDAIQNPEIISVVGGLLPIADMNNRGLVDKGRFVNLSNYTVKKLIKLTINIDAGILFFNNGSQGVGFIVFTIQDGVYTYLYSNTATWGTKFYRDQYGVLYAYVVNRTATLSIVYSQAKIRNYEEIELTDDYVEITPNIT